VDSAKSRKPDSGTPTSDFGSSKPIKREEHDAIRYLSDAQKRHLIELYGDGERVLFWHMTYGDPAHRSALALERRGLVTLEGSIIGREGGGYRLTERGREAARALMEAS